MNIDFDNSGDSMRIIFNRDMCTMSHDNTNRIVVFDNKRVTLYIELNPVYALIGNITPVFATAFSIGWLTDHIHTEEDMISLAQKFGTDYVVATLDGYLALGFNPAEMHVA